MEIIYSPQFTRKYKKLPTKIKDLAEAREKIFRQNPRDDRLDTHKLHGKLKHFWSFSVDGKFRVIFEFGENGTIYFHSVGDHDIYK